MIYELEISEQADNDLRGIFEYIAFELQSSQNASRGLRVLLVDNYVVFYIPDSDKKVVTILRVMYAGRDTDNQLNLYTKQQGKANATAA